MLFMVLVGIHVVILAMARTAVQAAADAAVAAAQAAGPDTTVGDCGVTDLSGAQLAGTSRECAGAVAAYGAMAASGNSIVATRPPAVAVAEGEDRVTVIVFGGTITPVFGGLEVTAQACGPLDDVPASALAGTDVWQCRPQ